MKTIATSDVLKFADNPDDTIALDSTARHRRRMALTSDNGIEFLLDLPQARMLKHGEGLELEDGRVIEVIAAPEELFHVTGRDTQHLLTLAWQIGNRHLAAQIAGDHILIRRDHVIRTMLEGLGAVVADVCEPFDPAGGAYSDHHSHQHHD